MATNSGSSTFNFRGMLLRPGTVTRAAAYLTEWGWRGDHHEWRYAGPDGNRHGPFSTYDHMLEHYISTYMPTEYVVQPSTR